MGVWTDGEHNARHSCYCLLPFKLVDGTVSCNCILLDPDKTQEASVSEIYFLLCKFTSLRRYVRHLLPYYRKLVLNKKAPLGVLFCLRNKKLD